MQPFFRYKIYIEYDGTFFHGWQSQDQLTTVQGSIEEALYALTSHNILVEGAGRTDTGVHATGQVGHFDLKKYYPPHRIQDALNFYLRKKQVVIWKVETVPMDFHARFSATSRTYRYCIINRRSPLALDQYRAWHVVPSLDVDQMQKAAHHLIGHHDFSAFRASSCQSNSPVKTLTQFDIQRIDQRIEALIESRSFLHNQVRIMMGTIKKVGEGKLNPDDLLKILQSRDRTQAGVTAPAHGLYLINVRYERL